MSKKNLQGVVSICSPVKTAFAPAIKHMACCGSARVFLPAARRIMVVGRTIRAVAIVRTRVWYGTGYSAQTFKRKANWTATLLTSFFSKGVPGIGTKALTGNDSGCSGMLDRFQMSVNVLWGRRKDIFTSKPPRSTPRDLRSIPQAQECHQNRH
jgi:hypothetical protein